MRILDIIAKKRDGQVLTPDEIDWFVDMYTSDKLPDYQAAALLMAICIRGMTTEEVTNLTQSMADSGDTLDLTSVADYVVDKHSSGGVGDKTSLVVLPLVAACGVPVAKMSGRGLGYSGGTLDKLEAIKGFQVNLSEDDFIAQAKRIGLVIAGQTRDLAPADGRIYALRDVTATVPSLPLIASSIMSKKLAAGAHGIVLDVKVGVGAFMTDLNEARDLATIMVEIGVNAGRDMIAVISDMNQPLGFAVGNALEVEEAVHTLNGEGPPDFRDHCLEIAGHMLRLAESKTSRINLIDAKDQLREKLDSGAAFRHFRDMVEAQGGDVRMIDDTKLLPQAAIVETIAAEQTGHLTSVAANKVAQAAFELGAGRERKGDPIDPAVGVRVHVKVGDHVQKGQLVATLYANDPDTVATCQGRLRTAFTFETEPVGTLPLFYDVVGID